MRKASAVGIVLLFLLASSSIGQVRELIENGGFESGTEGWQLTGKTVQDSKQAHTGNNCAFAEVSKPKQAQHCRTTLPLRANCVYRLSFWVRGSGRTKAVMFLERARTRRPLGRIKVLAGHWKKHTTTFSVPEDGEWTIDIVAPSSFGAPIGKAWVDDVSLIEVPLGPSLNVTQDKGVSEWTKLCICEGGETGYCAWIAFDDGYDTVRVAHVEQIHTEQPSIAGKWDVDIGKNIYAWRLAITAVGGEAHLAASCELQGSWDIYLVRVSSSGASKASAVTKDDAIDVNPSIARVGKRLMLAWETNRDGTRQIYVADVTDGKAGVPQRISKGDANNYNPCLAGNELGHAWLVWESFRDGGYDIYGAEFDGRDWSGEKRLTTDPRIEHRPRVAMGKDGFWLAWEVMEYGNYRTNAARLQKALVGKITPQGVMVPQDVESVFPNFTQHPTIAVDHLGRVWVVVRKSRGQHSGWDAAARCFNGSEWSPLRELTATPGRSQHVPVCTAGKRLVAAVQVDTVAGKYLTIEESKKVTSNVLLCGLDLDEAPKPVTAKLVKHAPVVDFPMKEERRQFGEELPPRSVMYNGKKLNLYWGDFHDHTQISVCNRRGDLPPEDNYLHNREIHKLDFSALTDHGYNVSPHVWCYLGKLARTFEDKGRYLTFLGEEWTSTFEKYSDEHPFGYYGHRNLIFADPYFPEWFNAWEGDTPQQVWDRLRKAESNFIHIPHQLADNGNVPTDWNFVDEEAQPIAEIFQARGSYEYRGAPREARSVVKGDGYFLREAWAKGVVIGVIASPDHGGGLGKAAVYAPELRREAILDACRARHTYGTTAAKIFLDVRVNGHLMGEKIKADGNPVDIRVDTIAPGEIARVDICRNNRFIHTENPEGSEAHLNFRDTAPLDETAFYYVRVIQDDEEIAWSSPVWLVK